MTVDYAEAHGDSGDPSVEYAETGAPVLRQHEAFIIDALNRRSPRWRASWDTNDFLIATKVHGVAALIADRAERGEVALPPEAAPMFHEVLDGHRVFELLHVSELHRLFSALEERETQFIILKGTALAYSVYDAPHLRTRSDTDLLISEADLTTVDGVLRDLGYDTQYGAQMTVASSQRSYSLTDATGLGHTIDLHWRISNRVLFAQAFGWDDLIGNTMHLPRLSDAALSLTPVYQLLHACMHRVCHLATRQYANKLTASGDRIIWLQDIAMIVRQFDVPMWQTLEQVCRDRGISAVVLDTLHAVCQTFPITIPETVRDALSVAGKREISRWLITRSRWPGLVVDLLVARHWRSKLILLREAAVPPSEQILALYGRRSRVWLPYLYLLRLLGRMP